MGLRHKKPLPPRLSSHPGRLCVLREWAPDESRGCERQMGDHEKSSLRCRLIECGKGLRHCGRSERARGAPPALLCFSSPLGVPKTGASFPLVFSLLAVRPASLSSSPPLSFLGRNDLNTKEVEEGLLRLQTSSPSLPPSLPHFSHFERGCRVHLTLPGGRRKIVVGRVTFALLTTIYFCLSDWVPLFSVQMTLGLR